MRNNFTAFAIVTLLGLPAAAQPPGSRQTRDFVQMAAQSDSFEMLEAETALAESKDPDIKAFAQMMISDHRQTRRALLDAVSRSGLKPPDEGIGSDQSMFLAALQSQRGVDFDKAYVKQQLLAHRAALAIQQLYASSGDDRNVRQAASDAVRIIQMHAEVAERIAAKSGDS